MDPEVEHRRQQCLMEDIESLKSQLSDLQTKFDLIVDWITSQYDDELTGLPESVVNAVRRNYVSTVKTESIKIKREKLSPAEMELVNVEVNSSFDQLEENSSCDKLGNLKAVNTDNGADKGELNKCKSFTAELDEIIMRDVEPMGDNCSIINLHSLKTNQKLRVKKTNKNVQESRAKKLILDAFEYEEIIASLPPDRLTCIVCNKIFSVPKKVRRHELEVHLTKEEQIIFRNRKNGSNSGNAEVKTKIVKNARPESANKCEICGLLIRAKNLNQHMNTHKGERNFLCNQCGQSFRRKHTLRMHEMAIHEKVRNHKCRYCEKTFVLRYVKNDHEKKHLGASKVTCSLCGFSFTCQRNLKRHIIGVHENRRLFNCHLCDKSFKTSVARKYHFNTHGNPNGRKRGLNAYVDPMKAAAKRRHCPDRSNYRVPELTTEMRATIIPVKTELEEY